MRIEGHPVVMMFRALVLIGILGPRTAIANRVANPLQRSSISATPTAVRGVQDRITEITVENHPGFEFGTLIFYALTLRSDGTATYIQPRWGMTGKKAGTYEAKIPQADFRALARRIERIGLKHFKPGFDVPIDAPSVTVSIVSQGRRIINIPSQPGRGRTHYLQAPYRRRITDERSNLRNGVGERGFTRAQQRIELAILAEVKTLREHAHWVYKSTNDEMPHYEPGLQYLPRSAPVATGR